MHNSSSYSALAKPFRCASQLDFLMPDNAAQLAMEHNLAVGYLRVTPWPKAVIVTEWESKADLIDTVRRLAAWSHTGCAANRPRDP